LSGLLRKAIHMRIGSASRAAVAVAFAGAARRYWLEVFPCARAELRHWRQRAGEIIDPALRKLAFEAQRGKYESIEGAVAFATFVPPASRAIAIRAITAYQVAFDYIDTISEQPGADPVANGHRLNQALLHALEPDGGSHATELGHYDYYAHHSCREDAGYLQDLVDTCRTALQALPSYAAIAESVQRATARIVAYQSLNHGDGHGSFEAFARWARAENRPGAGLRWWETGAAAGSPLPVFALIAAAAKPRTDAREAIALGNAYFPWIASLSSLLDNLIDRHEDAGDGQRNLLDYYASPAEAASRLQTLARRAVGCTSALSDGQHHTMILAAMASFYHGAPGAAEPDARLATQRILDVMVGDFALPSALLLRLRRVLGGVADRAAALRRAVQRALLPSAAQHASLSAGAQRAGAQRALSSPGVERAPSPSIRHTNSGIAAYAPPALLAGSAHATTDVRAVSRIPALGEEASPAAPVPGPVK
jgi:tetraprenyl-beta-curcumene synthase